MRENTTVSQAALVLALLKHGKVQIPMCLLCFSRQEETGKMFQLADF